MCIFIGCWPWSIRGHIHRSRQRTCFSFLIPPKSFNKSFEFLLYKTTRLHFPVCVCTVIDHTEDVTACKEQQSRHSTSSRVVIFVRYTLWRRLWAIIIHPHGRTVIYLLNILHDMNNFFNFFQYQWISVDVFLTYFHFFLYSYFLTYFNLFSCLLKGWWW